jgi:ubiquinone/menaquinone biosynthesis C-methylase UbiE
MNDQGSKWQTKELSQTFLEGVQGAIPAANLQLEVLSKIVNMWCPLPSKILDLGCGDGALGRMLIDIYPTVHMIFADFSEPMLEALRRQIEGNQKTTVINTDFATPAWIKSFEAEKPFDVIVSGFAIHHQTDNRKKELYAEIYGLLREGGVFLNLEHISSATPSGGALFDSFFVDHLLRFHRDTTPSKTRQEIEEVYYQRPDKTENILAPVETQCQWLRDIGFQDVDCFFKVFELALFGGRKHPTTACTRSPKKPAPADSRVGLIR